MTAVEIRGLDILRRRLAAASALQPIKASLLAEAEAIAEHARSQAPGELGQTVEVIDNSRGMRPAYAVGTAHPAARHLEFGTVRRAATPWLRPAFRARSAGVTTKLRKLIVAAFKTTRGGV